MDKNMHLKTVPHGLWNDGSAVSPCSCTICEKHKKDYASTKQCGIAECAYHKVKPKGWPTSTCIYNYFGKSVKGHEDKFVSKKGGL